MPQLSVEEELEYMEELLPANPKNFQIWYLRINAREHRMFFAKKTKDWERELKAVQETLEMDSKNYHCWVFRKNLCEYFDLFESEKVEVEKYIENDVGNNSAWSYRFFLLNRGNLLLVGDSQQIKKEIEYVESKLSLDESNEAAWNYLNGYDCFTQILQLPGWTQL